jgi:hypothetical protein
VFDFGVALRAIATRRCLLLKKTVLAGVYCEWKATMAVENLADVINSLTPEEQESVKQFVDFLKRRGTSSSSRFLAAVDEFVDQHPELLRRLAK